MDLSSLLSWADLTAPLAPRLGELACWAYAVLALTTLPPLLPNNLLLITSGMLAARGEMSLVLILLSVAGSAVLGDLLLHRLGRSAGDRLRRSALGGRRGELFAWASQQMRRRGLPFVVGVRFLPSGRLLGGLAAGATGCPTRRFLAGAAIAETVWAAYSVGAGYFGGSVSDDPVAAVALGLGLSLGVAAVATAVQRRVPRLPEAADAPKEA
ncbi:membrane protein DedA with SNARE-associated domain [Streptomyces griseochromogenes]|uniref:Membrane protein DedA with SNARE-associated domain n=1 Tax=Streptomyces griseochromogenes TaxID=68214 RepID=A0A1B1AP41_9ACTN|nr:VTT domain-containing protein [Streptomyces griseochromogenes]ANP48280.1 hypothetical protein AVL59_00680 [Streptomyces griseochromogenes]MBP2050785.1 membrane protein DedA with SNARE-associated domain [Streptomyces griseochromogenes]